jgi:Heparinase II/III-like protein/Heparinase II/III N-terminus
MSWGEFRARVAQEFGKRAEYAGYRVGLLRAEPELPRNVLGDGNFFFSPADLPFRVALINEHLPEALAETIVEADEILQHRFRLLGYRDLDYGGEIDWHLDAVHGKRAPLKPWYKIRFLDFGEVGDHKVTWELNRHQHLVTLARAWAFTNKTEYAQEIERQFYSWQATNPYPMGINWGSSLEVAFRSLSWLWVRNILAGSPVLSTSFDRDLVRGLARNGRYIKRYLSTYFSPNTHLLGEALALFFIGTLCPEIPAAKEWQQPGFNILLAEIQRQVRSDGVYFEQSLYYHVYALDFFLHAKALAARSGIQIPESFDTTVQRMLHVVAVLCRNGEAQGFGDDDGGRLFNPRRNRAEHMSDPLAVGVCLFEQVSPCAKPTEESIWMFGQEAIAACDTSNQPDDVSSCAFEDGGLYVIPSDGPHRSQMLVDAGPHGIGHGGHGHADALSVRLSMNDRPWLIDPGTYVYISAGDDRNEFRGTAAHNTVRVDGCDQAVPENAFSWSSLPEVTAEMWEQSDRFTYFSGSHTGYRRLADPVLHRRAIFHLHGEYWLIRDFVSGETEHDLEISWHFAPGIDLDIRNGSLAAAREDKQLILLNANSWDASIGEAFISPAYGEKSPAPVGAFKARRKLPAEHSTLIVPVRASEEPGRFAVSGAASAGATSYVYERGGTTDQVIFGNPGMNWATASLASDAEFLFIRRHNREISSLVFCSATFVEAEGQRVFSAPDRVRRFEWTSGAGASSDTESLKYFHGELIRPGTPVR